jgi:NAD(P)H-hydrate repair Nnr-like enzyme with NAD(P)H-hydrate dehydratase domain/NAD(P)H-hydrate repair Nnr-like enzyme with NAD(P)H-hydrate epimerase domain
MTIAILTPHEVRAIDAAAPEPVEVLVARAGAAVAAEALDLLGGGYGRRVTVIAGKGNNGSDGRVAATLLRRRGATVDVVDPTVGELAPCDLVIDAAFGTGFRGTWDPPDVHGSPVLAVDLPSGLDAVTGEGAALAAERTVTFQALKPVHLLSDTSGEIVVADIGLDVSSARAWLVEDGDVVLPTRPRSTHKWRAAVWVVAGSEGMTGAATLAARAAQRAGAGYVRLSPGDGAPVEAVAAPLPVGGWDGLDRFRAALIGPGMGRDHDELIRTLVATATVPCVVDGDGLTALGRDAKAHVQPTTILTPHEGEYERLAGRPPGADRFAAARDLATALGCVVLLKGSSTVVADPAGRVLVAAQGDARLASAGTGDVLSGIVGALAAQGVEPLEAAAWGAHVHGLAGQAGPPRGLVASDLVDRLPDVLSALG